MDKSLFYRKFTTTYNVRKKPLDVQTYHLHIVVDGQDLGFIEPGQTVTLNVNNGSHSIFYNLIIINGNSAVPIPSRVIQIPATYDIILPEEIEYVFNVSVSQNGSADIFKSILKQQLRMQDMTAALHEIWKVDVTQSEENRNITMYKEQQNIYYYQVKKATDDVLEEFFKNVFQKIDFSPIERLSLEARASKYMMEKAMPSFIRAVYIQLITGYFTNSIGVAFLCLILFRFRVLKEFEPIVYDSLKNLDYFATQKNDINSFFDEAIIEHLEHLRRIDFQFEEFDTDEFKRMKDKFSNILDRNSEVGRAFNYGEVKEIFDFIVSTNRNPDIMDKMKGQLIYYALLEPQRPELSKKYEPLRDYLRRMFLPLTPSVTENVENVRNVDMLIADAIHYSNVGHIEKIDECLRQFLYVLCPIYQVESLQYTILQKVFVWLKASKQEYMVLKAMSDNGVKMTDEQSKRLASMR